MQCVILAGGMGSRLSEETDLRPKPMVEIGDKPILWHIMQSYSHYGVTEFIICLGYKGYVIKEYFANYFIHCSDLTIDLEKNEIEFHNSSAEPWKVSLIDTGIDTHTGGRLKRVENMLKEETFCFTYGDGLSDVNIKSLIEFHQSHNAQATVTAVPAPGRFGALEVAGDQVIDFKEKRDGEQNWINGGFFVLDKSCLDELPLEPDMPWESRPMEILSQNQNLMCFRHTGFWYPMDTLRDKNELNTLWNSGLAPWKVWR
jgi:glucose-1-phosphate cytidylyltransferase